MITKENIATLMDDGVVLDESGDKIGKVGQVYLDDNSGEPEWVTVNTGWFGTSESFVPLQQASVQGSEVRVPFSKDKVKDAPRLDADEHISPQQEQELYRYYGVSHDAGTRGHSDVDTAGTTTGSPVRGDVTRPYPETDDDDLGRDRSRGTVGHDTSGPETDDAMTRSEEQLHVGTEKVDTGKARLRKHVVTDHVTKTVPVQREEVHVEREPITDANRGQATRGGDLTDEDHEVTLSEERVVTDKETVPVERVRMDKDTVTEQQEVSEDVRKEEIEADVPDSDRRR
jgi:uncharacterized protein (TIGR02271 family)